MKYAPEAPPLGADPILGEYLSRELARIAAALEQAFDLEKQYAAPARLIDGMVRYADGSSWNPGHGAGVYYYNGAGWIRLTGLPSLTVSDATHVLADGGPLTLS